MPDRHVGEKPKLYGEPSLFACDDGRPRYGCRGDLVVSVSLVETFGRARFTVDLREDVPALSDGQTAIPYALAEAALERHLARTGLADAMRQKVADLERGTDVSGTALSIAQTLQGGP